MNQQYRELPRPFVATNGKHTITVTPVRFITAERIKATVMIDGRYLDGFIYQRWADVVNVYGAIIANWGN